MSNFKDLTGKKFGKLKVIKRAENYVSPKGYSEVRWLCQCECGNTKVIRAASLQSGLTKSCGCIKLRDLSGQKFGRLEVLKKVGKDKSGISLYLCRCECGVEKIICSSNLLNQTTKSCGCYNKERTREVNKKYNNWTLNMNKNIAVGTDSKGNEFIIDIEDWQKCKDNYWMVSPDKYVITLNNKKILRLHRYLMNCPKDMVVDHINGDTTNNCKSNLRVCTQQQNALNHTVRCDCISGHTGVYWRDNLNKWEVYITYNKNSIYLGSYKDKDEAIKARKKAESELFGEFKRS